MIIQILTWLNSLNNWQQAIVGIPYALILGFIFLYLFKQLKIIRYEQ